MLSTKRPRSLREAAIALLEVLVVLLAMAGARMAVSGDSSVRFIAILVAGGAVIAADYLLRQWLASRRSQRS